MPLTAGTPLDVLTDRLRRAGWGDLNTPALRGLHRVLDDLGRTLDRRSGAGKVTATQIAERVGFTERWVRRCLELLEELEVIQWDRGGIVAGKPTPSWVRVSKAVLVDLIHAARERESERLAARSTETRLRVARLRTGYTRAPRKPTARQRQQDRNKRRPVAGGVHAELVTTLRSTEEVSGGHGPAGVPARGAVKDEKAEAPASTDTARSAVARIRADLAARRGLARGEERSDDDSAPRPAARS